MKRVFVFKSASRSAVLLCGAALVSACGGLIPAGQAPASYQAGSDRSQVSAAREYPRAVRPQGQSRSTRQPVRVASAPMSPAFRSQGGECLTQLGATGARFSTVPDSYAAPGCNKVGTVKIAALSGDNSQFRVSNLGAVKCETAQAFNNWARFGVDRAARQILGSPLAQIETMGSYACRNIAGMNRRSAHATGNAIDVSGFVLADGRRIVLKGDWDGGTPAEREFLRVVFKSACKRFGTVLGPEYNAAHRDHFHLEGTGATFCR